MGHNAVIQIGTRVRMMDTGPPAEGVVAKTPESYWEPGTQIRRLPPGVVWVEFDGGGAPWSVDQLEPINN